MGKIGPQKRVSHVGKQVAAAINKQEGSRVQQTNVKTRESKKMKRQSQSVEDKFSLDNILNVQQKLLKSSEGSNYDFPLGIKCTMCLKNVKSRKVLFMIKNFQQFLFQRHVFLLLQQRVSITISNSHFVAMLPIIFGI